MVITYIIGHDSHNPDGHDIVFRVTPIHFQEWNFQLAYEQGLLNRPALALPPWDHTGEDPLEENCGEHAQDS